MNAAEVTVFPTKGHTSEDRLMDVYHSTGKGPVYVTQGNTGAAQGETWVQPQPAWSAVRMANGFSPPNRTTVVDSHIRSAGTFSSGEEERKSSLSSESVSVEGHVLPSTYTDTFGFGLITVMNYTHLFYHSIPITGKKDDKFWIVKRT